MKKKLIIMLVLSAIFVSSLFLGFKNLNLFNKINNQVGTVLICDDFVEPDVPPPSKNG